MSGVRPSDKVERCFDTVAGVDGALDITPVSCTKNTYAVTYFIVKHILTECTSYDQARHQYYSFTDIKNILNLTTSQNILNFIFKNRFI